MSVIFGLENVPTISGGRAVAVGVFDGVHWGHRAIFEQLCRVAKEAQAPGTVMTFERHPAELLALRRVPSYINTLDQRVELILDAGVDEVIVADFSPAIAGLSRDEFVERILRDVLQANHVVVGSNFRFGRNREGNTRYLAKAAPEMGIQISVVPAVVIDGGPVSSTRVRAAITRGDVEAAARLLGRRFALRGKVVAGNRIGRKLGFPTANIQTEPRQLVPARGVYGVEVTVGGSTYSGVCNIGSRPTFGAGPEAVEVHLSGFQGSIYGETLDVVFCRRLRDEMVFESPEHLADQIKQDLERASRACKAGRNHQPTVQPG